LSTHSRAAGEPVGAGDGPVPPPQPAASAAAANEAAAQAARGRFEPAPYVAQFQQPNVPAMRTSVTLLPVTCESVVMVALYVPLFDSGTPW
jgi:hypothetical protein